MKLLSTSIYRTSFHPLAKFPGPLLGRITDLYSVYHAWKGDRHIDFQRLHQQYGKPKLQPYPSVLQSLRTPGDVVRYGPNRISINTNTALHNIYQSRSNVQKSKFYNIFSAFFAVPGTITIINKATHGFRRRIVNQALTAAAVKSMERLMLGNIRSFCNELVENKSEEDVEPLSREWSAARNMTDWLARLTFDIVGDLCFGRNWNVVRSERNRSFLKIIPAGTAGLLIVRQIFPMAIPGFMKGMPLLFSPRVWCFGLGRPVLGLPSAVTSIHDSRQQLTNISSTLVAGPFKGLLLIRFDREDTCPPSSP